jgi:hypothetical protein
MSNKVTWGLRFERLPVRRRDVVHLSVLFHYRMRHDMVAGKPASNRVRAVDQPTANGNAPRLARAPIVNIWVTCSGRGCPGADSGAAFDLYRFGSFGAVDQRIQSYEVPF